MAPPRLTPLGVMILALLEEGEMHPYEMMRLMRMRGDDRLVSLTNGTFYHTVSRLEAHGLMAEVGVDRDGRRPERTTYRLLAAGRAAALDWVREGLAQLDSIPDFRVALAEAHNLPLSEVVGLLRTRHDALRVRLDAQVDMLTTATGGGVSPRYLLEIELSLAHQRTEIAWIEGLLGRLPGLPWGPRGETPTALYLAQRKAARA